MRKAIENKTMMPLFVAGVMIPPGETRHFEDDQIPPEHREPETAAAPEPEADLMAELAAKNAATVIAALEGLSSEDLARLQLIEADGKARKTVMEGIAAEGLKRAQSVLDADKDADQDAPAADAPKSDEAPADQAAAPKEGEQA